LNVASAAQRSQNTVPVPYDVLAAKDTFASVNPYVGFGAMTTAAHAVKDIAYFAVADTPLSTPPGALVVSTSTTVEPSTCGCGVAGAVGVIDVVPELDGVIDAVGEGEREPVGVPLGDGDTGSVGVPVRVPDAVALDVGVALADGVCVPVLDRGAPPLAVFDKVAGGEGVPDVVAVADGVMDDCTTPWT